MTRESRGSMQVTPAPGQWIVCPCVSVTIQQSLSPETHSRKGWAVQTPLFPFPTNWQAQRSAELKGAWEFPAYQWVQEPLQEIRIKFISRTFYSKVQRIEAIPQPIHPMPTPNLWYSSSRQRYKSKLCVPGLPTSLGQNLAASSLCSLLSPT